MKMMLSMPSTSSSAVNVKNAIQTCGSERRAMMASMSGRHIRTKLARNIVLRPLLLQPRLPMRPVLCDHPRCCSCRCRAHARLQSGEVRIWEVQEITLAAARHTRIPTSTSNAGSTWKARIPPRVRLLGWRTPLQGTHRRHASRRVELAGRDRTADDTGLSGSGNSAPWRGPRRRSTELRTAVVSCAPRQWACVALRRWHALLPPG